MMTEDESIIRTLQQEHKDETLLQRAERAESDRDKALAALEKIDSIATDTAKSCALPTEMQQMQDVAKRMIAAVKGQP